MPLRHYCARCNSENDSLLWGLCDSCRPKIANVLAKARALDWDAQRDIANEYGVDSIEEALVIKKWGGSRVVHACYNCGKKISDGQAQETRGMFSISTESYCSNCVKVINRRRAPLDKARKRDRGRFNGL